MAEVRGTDGTAVVWCKRGQTIADTIGMTVYDSSRIGVGIRVVYDQSSQNTAPLKIMQLNDGGSWEDGGATLGSKTSITLPAISLPTLGSFSLNNVTPTGTIPPGMSQKAVDNPTRVNGYTIVFYGIPTSAGVFNYTITVTQDVTNWRGVTQSQWLTYFPVEFHIYADSYLNQNANGGKFSDQSTVITQSVYGYTAPTYTITTAVPTRAGYRFLGWSTSSTATSASYSGGGSYTGVLDGTSTLYAVWSLITYTHTIAYNANGGSGSMNASVVTDTNAGNSNVTVANCSFNPPATGYYFTGWKVNNTGNIINPATYPVAANSSVTFYAQWSNLYSVAIGVNNSAYGSVSSTSITNIPYGSAITLNGNRMTINGVTVTATPAATTAQYSYAFSSWGNASGTITTSRGITANFTRTTRSYAVTLSKIGHGSVTGAGTYNYGTSVTITATAESGYSFVCWSDGNANASRTFTLTGAVSLMAYFTVRVRWYNGTTLLETDTNVIPQYGTYPSNPTTPTYNGATPTKTSTAQYSYTFSGWSPTVGKVSGDTDYSAQFSSTLRNYAITVNIDSSANYGSISPTTVANKDYGSSYSVSGTVLTVGGTAVTATATTSTAQYTYGFDGWYIGSTKITSAGTITGATTFTAKFTRTLNQYVITVTAGSYGSATGGGTYNYGATATLTATADTDYVFEKWQDNNTDNPRTVTVTGAATYTAYFAPDAPSIGVKVNGAWVSGTPWVKVNGNWVKSKKMYVKDNGTWKEVKRI